MARPLQIDFIDLVKYSLTPETCVFTSQDIVLFARPKTRVSFASVLARSFVANISIEYLLLLLIK